MATHDKDVPISPGYRTFGESPHVQRIGWCQGGKHQGKEHIKPGCNNDQGFILTTWRQANDSDERWGSCFYHVRPRYKTFVGMKGGYWKGDILVLAGEWRLATDEPIDLQRFPPGIVRVRVQVVGGQGTIDTQWRTAPIASNGTFQVAFPGMDKGDFVYVRAFYDRTSLFGSCTSKTLQLYRTPPPQLVAAPH